MAANPHLTEREWKRIAAVLPPSGGVGRPRHGDREGLAVLLHLEALARNSWVVRPALQGLVDHKMAQLLVTKRAKWKRDGLWPQLLAAGAPAIERMRARERRRDGNSDMAKIMRLYERPRA